MAFLFSFFLRLFLCFLAAKFILQVFEAQSRGYLLGLTALFLANVYWLDYLSQRGRLPERARKEEAPRQEAPPESEAASETPPKGE